MEDGPPRSPRSWGQFVRFLASELMGKEASDANVQRIFEQSGLTTMQVASPIVINTSSDDVEVDEDIESVFYLNISLMEGMIIRHCKRADQFPPKHASAVMTSEVADRLRLPIIPDRVMQYSPSTSTYVSYIPNGMLYDTCVLEGKCGVAWGGEVKFSVRNVKGLGTPFIVGASYSS
ncbi:hypothetical protein BGZ63DRAFT_406781 [Mariannaea sp. PMI_226]|nr:hypothetical protein BGZ63DRAFT_406781 [Mariannaea sp. PMI_226]